MRVLCSTERLVLSNSSPIDKEFRVGILYTRYVNKVFYSLLYGYIIVAQYLVLE